MPTDVSQKVVVLGDEFSVNPSKNPAAHALFNKANRKGIMYLHNHPSTNRFSFADIMEFVRNGPIALLSVVTNQGGVHILYKTGKYSFERARTIFSEIYTLYQQNKIEHNEAVKLFLKQCEKGGIIYAKST